MRPDTRLAVPAAIAWAVLGILLGTPDAVPWAAGGFWAAGVIQLVVAALSAIRHRPVVQSVLLGGALCATLAALMLSSAAVAASVRQPGVLVDAADDGVLVRAVATTTQTVHDGADRFTATLASGTAAERQFSGSVPVVVFGSLARPTGIGAEVGLVGTLAVADAGGSAAFLYFLSDTGSVVRGPPWYLDWAGALRSGFLEVATSLPGAGGDLLPGLAIGDTSAVDSRLDAAMKASSLSHLTAVSGANCAVIIALVMLGGAALGLSRGWRIATSIGVLIGFVVLVTPEPSVLRAAVMAAIVLAAVASGRPISGVPVLGLAVVLLLVIDPWLARSFGFVLSVCAAAGLLLVAAPLARGLSRWMPYPLALLVSVPAAAQFACQPVLILLSPSIPTFGVVANMLAAPAAPLATVLGLVVCLLVPFVPLLGGLVAHLAWLPSAWIAAVATFFSGLPLASLPWLSGAWGSAAAVLIGVLSLMAWRGHGGRARAAFACLLLVGVVYLGVSGGEQLRRRLSPPADWAVAACDVGQGDAMLVRSADRVAVIDAGPDPALLDHCLDTLGAPRIDILVLTHFDLDHVGGVPAVLGRVDRVLVGPSAGPDDDRIVQQLADAGAIIEQVARGRSGELGQLQWQVLWPPRELAGIEPGNDASVVVEFAGRPGCVSGCLDSVFLGDLGEEAQSRLQAVSRLGNVDVVKVSHHGSRDQHSRLYERLRASVGVIGVGAGNDYGHPADGILQLLTATGTTVVRTDLSGMALLSSRDGALSLWTERSGGGPPE